MYSGGAGVKLGLGGTLVLLVLSLVFKQDMFALLGTSPGITGGGWGRCCWRLEGRDPAALVPAALNRQPAGFSPAC